MIRLVVSAATCAIVALRTSSMTAAGASGGSTI